ncbi:MAG: TIGR00730 family Rossman fold protein [Prosthecochloris sp.]|nr:TIGR00730 family Rossman fold protein [Prosthecochloris sp.]
MMNVTVYCSSSDLAADNFISSAHDLGAALARKGLGIVFGGGDVGLMGCVANAAMDSGGSVKGVIPRFLEEKEIAHRGISELHVVETMHERKMLLTEWADAFIVLPGGFGTLDELIEVITWRHLGHHDKPVLLYNIDDFWAPLTDFFATLSRHRMVRTDHQRLYTICDSLEEILGELDRAARKE